MRGVGDSGVVCQEERTKDWLLEQTGCRSCGDDSSDINTSDTVDNSSSNPIVYANERDIASNSSKQTVHRSSGKYETSSEINSNQQTDCRSYAKKYDQSNVSDLPVNSEIQTVWKSCGDKPAKILNKQKVYRSSGDDFIHHTHDRPADKSNKQTDC